MPWGEAVRLVRILRNDPASQFAASVEGWKHALSHTDLILMRQFELTQAAAGSKKPVPYPLAPWVADAEIETERFGNAQGMSPDVVKERLKLAAIGQLPAAI